MTTDLRALCRETPALAAALSTVLDRVERRGRLPGSVTLRAGPAVEQALCRAFSARWVRASEGRVRIGVAGAAAALGPEGERRLLESMYEALERAPRDVGAESRAHVQELERELTELLPVASTMASRAWLRAEIEALVHEAGEALAVARAHGVAHAGRVTRDVVRAVDAAVANDAPVRVQTFSAKVLGSSKALRPASDTARLLGIALYAHDPQTRRLIHEQSDPPPSVAQRMALEVNGIYRDEVAASVLCFGPIVYRSRGQRFDHVARHAQQGESSRLIVHQLAEAELERPAARRVTVFENLTPYLDYVDLLMARGVLDEVVIHAGGQASWAVVRLLGMCARHRLPIRHAGDLDRSGVLILRSLARRAGARILPVGMDVATHQRYVDRGQPITAAESQRLRQMLATDPPDRACHALLAEIARTGIWIEQEAFTDERLASLADR